MVKKDIKKPPKMGKPLNKGISGQRPMQLRTAYFADLCHHCGGLEGARSVPVRAAADQQHGA
jgi:hypothetical protein